MGLLDRVRSWLGGVLGSAEPEDEEGQTDADSRLDPENVTTVRKEADEDPAAKLSDVREQRADDGDGEE